MDSRNFTVPCPGPLDRRCACYGGPARISRRRFVQIAVHDLHRVAMPAQRVRHRVSHHHGTMPAPRTTEGDRQITFPLADIVRDEIREQALDAPQEFAGLGKRTYVSTDA